MSPTTQSRRGRKPIRIDLRELEKLAALQCIHEEIAGWFGVSTRTIENRRRKPEFAQVIERGRAMGCSSVRRAQMKLLEGGNGTMGVWLGKQFLGQRDIVTTEHTGRAEPVEAGAGRPKGSAMIASCSPLTIQTPVEPPRNLLFLVVSIT